MRRIAWIFVLALVMGLVPAMADSWTWTFTSDVLNADGTLVGSNNGDGSFNITSGIIHDVALGTGSIIPNPAPPGLATSADGRWNFDDQLFPTASALLDTNGLLFGIGTTDVNIYWDNNSNGAYVRYPEDGSGGYGTSQQGVFAIVSTPDGGTTLSLLGLAIVGLAGLRRKLSL